MEEKVRTHYSVWSPITSGKIWNFYYRGWGFLLRSCINKFDNSILWGNTLQVFV